MEVDNECRIARYSAADRVLLEKFFKDVWTPSPQAKSVDWFDWVCDADPNAGASRPTVLLAYIGERIVGMLVLVPTPIWVDGTPHEIAWGRDLFVDPGFRRYKIGLLLNDSWLDSYQAALGSGQSKIMRNLQQKHGWTEISLVTQQEKLFFDRQLIKNSLGDGIGTFCKRLIAMCYAGLWRRRTGSGGEDTVVHKHDFDARVDDLWLSCRLDYSRICARDLRTLTWRFTEHPYYQYSIFEIAGHDGAYRGYLVARRENNVCWIVDILTRKNDHLARRTLICQAENHFLKKGVTRFICRSVCPSLMSALRSRGYLATPFEQYACIKSKKEFPIGKKSAWYITAMDSDLDR